MEKKQIPQIFAASLIILSTTLTLACSASRAQSHLHQVNSSTAKSAYTQTIAELADKAKAVVDAGMREFNENTMPHQAKELRKQIVRLRDLLDVFPHNFAHRLELWDKLRDELDDGYTVVGDYKDLFDTNPEAVRDLENGIQPKYKNQEKLSERRKKVLNWKAKYLAQGGLAEEIQDLFLDIQELDAANISNSKKYSDFFWGGVKAQPLPEALPAENARRLVDAQAELATREHPDVLDINDPSTHKNELLFHDHRKRLRTIAKVCNVANALSPETCDTSAVKDIESLVIKLGEIEDLIITGRHLEEDGKKKKSAEAYEDAHKKFKKLKKNYEQRNMLESITRL